MQTVQVKIKRAADSKWTKNAYAFRCPVKDIKVGDLVLLDNGKGEEFAVGKVVKILEDNKSTAISYILCRLPIRERVFEDRIKTVRRSRNKNYLNTLADQKIIPEDISIWNLDTYTYELKGQIRNYNKKRTENGDKNILPEDKR